MASPSGRRWRGRLTLTIGLTLAAGLTLGYLGLRAVGDREQATRITYAATSVLIRDRLLAELSTIETEVGRRLAGPQTAEASADALRQSLHGRDVNKTTPGELLLMRKGGGVATSSLTLGWTVTRISTSIGSLAFAAAIREAEASEFRRNDLDAALGHYRRARTMASSPATRALASSRIGRVLFKLGQFEPGVEAYREVLASSSDVADSHGIPYAVTARRQIADGLESLGRTDERRRAGVDLLAWILDHPWDGRDGYGYYLAHARKSFGTTNSDLDARAARLIDTLDRLEWLDRVVRPRFEAEPETTDASDAAFKRVVADRDGSAVLVTARRLPRAPSGSSRPPTWVGYALAGNDVAGPLLDRVLGGVDLGRDRVVTVVDQQGRDLRTSGTSVVPLASADLGLFTWRIAILDSRGRTLEQLGARERWSYRALVLGMIVVLLAGLSIAARAWAREAELSRLRADFVSNVSHELKTPLALIRMFGETLESGLVTDPARQHEFHGIIRRESERLTHLINNVLDIAKIDAGTKRFVLSPSDLRALVVETLDAYAPLLKQLGFTVSADIPESPVVIDMDRNAIAQALVNLFQNAIKYSRETRHITLSLADSLQEIRLAVSDRGVGIAASEIPRIFEKYYRVATSEVEGTAGSGLGLAIVQHAMTGHGGRVEVTSTPGQGSTFTLLFPRQASALVGAASGVIPDGRVPDVAVH